MRKFQQGYLEAITESWRSEDIEDSVRVFDDCWRRYNAYLSESFDAFPPKIQRFVDGYVLGKAMHKRLHDDVVSKLSLSLRTSKLDSAEVHLGVLHRSQERPRSLEIRYSGVISWEFPVGESYLLIDRHELFRVDDGFQHNIYFVGCSPARIVFTDLEVVSA